ncbi:MAG: exosome complex protein Rrp4 [Candidatus Micrarchaeota archaeon]|nr:exosome complex protein Rrp4 [Candidatus Micrarchaeota archaeon]
MRRIVYPGYKLADKKLSGRGVYYEGGASYAALVGFFDDEAGVLIPLEGAYEPEVGDLLVGFVSDIKPNGYRIYTGLPNNTFMSSKDFRDPLDVGDIIIAKVREVDELKDISLVDPVLLKGGNVIRISPVKVPRVIGKKGSMLMQIKEATGSNIVVGKNGWIWISGGNEYLATRAILKIEAEAHTSGLTDRIAEFLKKGGME